MHNCVQYLHRRSHMYTSMCHEGVRVGTRINLQAAAVTVSRKLRRRYCCFTMVLLSGVGSVLDGETGNQQLHGLDGILGSIPPGKNWLRTPVGLLHFARLYTVVRRLFFDYRWIWHQPLDNQQLRGSTRNVNLIGNVVCTLFVWAFGRAIVSRAPRYSRRTPQS